jgi:hypothetical protein
MGKAHVPPQERAAHFARGNAGRLSFRHETFHVGLPAAREHLGVVQAGAVLAEQLERHHFRFWELIAPSRRDRVGQRVNARKERERERAPYPVDAEQIFLRSQNLFGFLAKPTVVLDGGGFETTLVPE